ncbi:MAG: RNA polymerase sigma factor [Pirellulales bacterium]
MGREDRCILGRLGCSLTEIVEFLHTHGCALFKLLYRVTLRDDVSEDLMQELFLKLKASEAFRTAACPLAYARRTALHLAFDWRRKRARWSGAELANGDLPDDRPSPLERLIEAEQIQAVLHAMTGLSDRSCELLMLHYVEQQTYETLAQEYDRTSHQIRALCHKALVQLRELLSDTSQGTR